MRQVERKELTNSIKKVELLYYNGFLNDTIVCSCVRLNICMCLFPGPRGKHQSNPVKFSTKPDLPSDVCEHLLAKYMPPSIRKTKTLQQLFLRYVLSKPWNLCLHNDHLPWFQTCQCCYLCTVQCNIQKLNGCIRSALVAHCWIYM